MGFSRQEQWSRLPCPPPGDRSNTEIEPTSLSLLHWQVGSLPLVPPGSPYIHTNICILFQILLILSWNFISLCSSFSRCDLVSCCFLNNRCHQKRTRTGSHPSAHLRASVRIDPAPPLVTVNKLCSCRIPPPVYQLLFPLVYPGCFSNHSSLSLLYHQFPSHTGFFPLVSIIKTFLFLPY